MLSSGKFESGTVAVTPGGGYWKVVVAPANVEALAGLCPCTYAAGTRARRTSLLKWTMSANGVRVETTNPAALRRIYTSTLTSDADAQKPNERVDGRRRKPPKERIEAASWKHSQIGEKSLLFHAGCGGHYVKYFHLNLASHGFNIAVSPAVTSVPVLSTSAVCA
jgi:hypothetical protein